MHVSGITALLNNCQELFLLWQSSPNSHQGLPTLLSFLHTTLLPFTSKLCINYIFLFSVFLMFWPEASLTREKLSPPRAGKFLGNSKWPSSDCDFHMQTNQSRDHAPYYSPPLSNLHTASHNPYLSHPRARYQTTRGSPTFWRILKWFKLANTKPASPALSVPSHGKP